MYPVSGLHKGEDHMHSPGTWFTRRRSKGRGDACVAPTARPGGPLPLARVPGASQTPCKFASHPLRPCGAKRARKPARGAVFAISRGRRAGAAKCANLYLYPYRPTARRTNASPTGMHPFGVMGRTNCGWGARPLEIVLVMGTVNSQKAPTRALQAAADGRNRNPND